LIHNDAYQNAIANGICDAVIKYRLAVGGAAAQQRRVP
jgi:hypothetical protein